jgi:hypothetical protein
MPITCRQYAEEHVEAVRRFNDRLRAGGETSKFPLSPVPTWLPKIVGRKLFQEYYLAIDDTAAVRGAYILKHQDFQIKDRVVSIADIQQPISEGAVDKRYPQVGVQLLRDAIDKQPLLYGLGMGGYDEAFPRLLQAAKWSMSSIAFFFRVVHPVAFLRNVSYLHGSAVSRHLLDILAATGLGWLGIRAMQSLCCRKAARDPAITVEVVDEFSTWADQLWQQAKSQYGMTAVRDAETLRVLYPKDDRRFIRLRVSRGAAVVGWAVLLNTRISNHKQFGNMQLGSIADCFGLTTETAAVVGAARTYLESHGADLIVSNQSHAAWGRGFRRAGFLCGPSNFIFASSPKLTELLRQCGLKNEDLCINRGDGDGPINL